MTLKEQIEAASAKATQGVWRIAAYYHNSGTPDERCGGFIEADDSPTGVIDENWMQDSESLSRDLDFIVALVNEYRAGRLVHIDEGMRKVLREVFDAGQEWVMDSQRGYPTCDENALIEDALATLKGESA